MKNQLNELASNATSTFLTENAEIALQASIELLLTTVPTAEVVRRLRLWADYLEERQ